MPLDGPEVGRLSGSTENTAGSATRLQNQSPWSFSTPKKCLSLFYPAAQTWLQPPHSVHSPRATFPKPSTATAGSSLSPGPPFPRILSIRCHKSPISRLPRISAELAGLVQGSSTFCPSKSFSGDQQPLLRVQPSLGPQSCSEHFSCRDNRWDCSISPNRAASDTVGGCGEAAGMNPWD